MKFEAIGCRTTEIERFGDGKYCNKIAQWNDALEGAEFDHFIFLDTDTIFVSNSLCELRSNAICAKVVDLANPPIAALEEIMRAAGFGALPAKRPVEANGEETYYGNSNGGMLSVPREFARVLFENWRRWALWLLDNLEPLRRLDKQGHVDQVSFCMAVHKTKLPFQYVSSNLNYFLHFAGVHSDYDSDKPISLLHYHNVSINALGSLDPPGAVTAAEREATRRANVQIARHFDNKLFWEMRYAHFLDRGSGVGSRGDNLEYKRRLLRACGAERAGSVLDVGCGDLEVVKALSLRNYVGIDQSATILELAKLARPDWTFLQAPCPQARASELVLCFEVLIHQKSASTYHALIGYLAEKTERVLLVSGYETDTEAIRSNPMLSFHEPLSSSLKRTGKFESIEIVGRHTDVTIFRCVARASEFAHKLRRWLRAST